MDNTERSHFGNWRSRQEFEEIVVMIRLHLYNQAIPCGPKAILKELDRLEVHPLYSTSTISRILAKNCLSHRRTGKYE